MHTIKLFDAEVIVQNFQNMEDAYPNKVLHASTKPNPLPENKYYTPEGTFTYKSTSYDIQEYLKDTRTEGLLIIHRDTIIYEAYFNDLQKDETHISWSMAKSFTATLIGVFYEKGLFQLSDPVTDYVPELKGSGYDGVTIKNLLQMSTGVHFNEDYGDFNSDINRFGRAFAMGSSLLDFSKSLKKEKEQGLSNHYVSINTQVLGIFLTKLTGKSFTELTQEYIWEPIGMEHNGSWIVDNEGMEVVLGGLNATLRDFSKLGLLYMHKGVLNGNRVISEKWVKDATTPDAPHLLPGNHELSTSIHGYGYQWWIPENNHNCYAMGGIYNQYVYADPINDIVITKLSANHKYKQEGHVTKSIHFEMFDAIIEDIVKNEQ